MARPWIAAATQPRSTSLLAPVRPEGAQSARSGCRLPDARVGCRRRGRRAGEAYDRFGVRAGSRAGFVVSIEEDGRMVMESFSRL